MGLNILSVLWGIRGRGVTKNSNCANFFNKKQLMKKGLLTLAILEVCRKMALVVEVEHRSTFTFSFQFLKPCTLHRCTLGGNKQKKFLFFTFSHSNF